jgi:Protein of unknown function (DUF3618)
MANQSLNTSDLEREVAVRRERLDRDLADLQTRLSPGQMLDEGLDYIRRSQGTDFLRNLGSSVTDRPLPVALVGIGLAWLAAGGPGPTARVRTEPDDGPGIATRAWEAGRGMVRQAGETEAAYRERALQARAQVLGLARHASETLDTFRDRVEEALYSARDQASALRDRLANTTRAGYERAQDYTGRAGKTASRTWESVGRTTGDMAAVVGDNPILLGALGVMAGALLGAAVPRSRVEEEMLAPMADRTVETARNFADEAMRRGDRAARAAAKAAGEATAEDSRAEEATSPETASSAPLTETNRTPMSESTPLVG